MRLSKRFMFLLCTLLSVYGFQANAQLTYTGTVLSTEDNQPLIGATVLIKGTNTGVVTDIDGSFSIEAEPGQVLVFTYTGFESQEYPLTTETDLEVALSPDNLILDEVVITGYGEKQRSA